MTLARRKPPASFAAASAAKVQPGVRALRNARAIIHASFAEYAERVIMLSTVPYSRCAVASAVLSKIKRTLADVSLASFLRRVLLES